MDAISSSDSHASCLKVRNKEAPFSTLPLLFLTACCSHFATKKCLILSNPFEFCGFRLSTALIFKAEMKITIQY